ncbi:MAG: AMIN domain-containing protein [Campylobacterales bacterium]
MRYLWLCVLWVVAADARLNPFVPLEAPESLSDSRALPPRQLSKEEIQLPPSARILKSVTLTHQDVDGSINRIDKRVDKLIDWHAPVTLNQPEAAHLPRQMGIFAPVEAVEEFEAIRFFTADEVMKLNTHDTMIRHFFLPKPSRVVMDFNNTVPFENRTAKLEGPFFSHIEMSFHATFYRVVITLDSYYPYRIETVKDGYLLGLN